MGADAAVREIEAGARDEVMVGLGDGPWTEDAVPAGEHAHLSAKAVGSGG
jgi:hypothetical protein